MDVDDFVREAAVMKKIHHPNLLQLYAVCTLREPIYIVTELMKHGSLLEYMRTGDGRYIQLSNMIDMIAQVASGRHYSIACRSCIVYSIGYSQVLFSTYHHITLIGFLYLIFQEWLTLRSTLTFIEISLPGTS